MKKRYQIEKQRAVQRFRKLAGSRRSTDPTGDSAPRRVLDLYSARTDESGDGRLHQTRRMRDGPRSHCLSRREESRQSCPRTPTRWGSEPGYCVVGGQKIPRPRRSHPAPSVGFIAGGNLRTRRRFPPRQRPRAVRFFSPRFGPCNRPRRPPQPLLGGQQASSDVSERPPKTTNLTTKSCDGQPELNTQAQKPRDPRIPKTLSPETSSASLYFQYLTARFLRGIKCDAKPSERGVRCFRLPLEGAGGC